ncbi:preprotein translocase subunit Sss1 [Alkalibacillus filiformis]|uniref:Preprotein translocase subunit Sss1 n=1 Tax=Alkalibacillus filiformis TaxID=200990 RepID=A0ABU0DP68_9BACI|nr:MULTISPECIES: hypothetical protein [Alkalibacillus]MDQ0350253.1 preprotein translocase subunit Sss1 [Alkalibacillus filiformis]MDV2582923.1 hypothetical protein [Alkalibacillus haloalkaliphilus]
MFDFLKPEKKYGVVGLALLIVGVAGFVILELYYTLWLHEYQLASLFFWGVGFIGSILYIVDLIRKRTNT